LQFALTASVANRAIKRVICQQEFAHRALSLLNLFTLGGHVHAVGTDDRARGLELWHFLNSHQAHPT
jgi:hypothetical protein